MTISASAPSSIIEFIKIVRPKQWTKNLFVFAPLIFSGHLFELDNLFLSIMAFILFSLMSSVVYILNDMIDIEKDRLHPKKRFRPLAKGTIGIPDAILFGLLLLCVTLTLSWKTQPLFFFILLLYSIMNILYSFWLKHIVLVDVSIIAFGFVLRVLGGSLILPVVPSFWLLLCTFQLALFLGLCKRRSEMFLLKKGAASHRKVLENYTEKLLDNLIMFISLSVIASYCIYTTVNPYPIKMACTIPMVIYSLFRYISLTFEFGKGEEPAIVLLSDLPFLLSIIIWCGLIVVFSYPEHYNDFFF